MRPPGIGACADPDRVSGPAAARGGV